MRLPASLFALLLFLCGALAHPHSALAAQSGQPPVRIEKVATDVYALIGSTGPRSYDNYGLNANFGLIVTPAGAVLIDSGTGAGAAAQLARAARSVTSQPIRWVINTGSQDHRWLGNGYFAAHGARVIALARTVATQQAQAGSELASLKPLLKDRLAGTRPLSAAHPLPGDLARLELGGVKIELHYLGDAHFPGDAVVWLPKQRVLFSGDLIFTDRMLGILPMSKTVSWDRAFHRAERQFPEATIVPGHGSVGDWALARRDTGDYLDWLLKEIRPAVARWDDLGDTVNRLDRSTPQAFRRLEHADTLNRTNINRTYLQLQQSAEQ